MGPFLRYRFGPFACDTRNRVLFRTEADQCAPADLTVVPLTPKAFETLIVLLQHPGEVLSRDDLMKAVWPETYVEEGSLTRNISALRKALGDETGTPLYIETLPRRGYRFAAPVSVESFEAAPVAPPAVAIASALEAPDGQAAIESGEPAPDSHGESGSQLAPDSESGPDSEVAPDGGKTTDGPPGARNEAVAILREASADAPRLEHVGAVVGAHERDTTASPPASLETRVPATPIFKNRRWLVGLAVLVFSALVALPALWGWLRPGTAEAMVHPALASINTVAVLPFNTLDPAGDAGHLGAGIADAIITRLARTGVVQVRPTRMVLSLTERRDIQAIGRQLGVDAVLDGTLQRVDGRMRVTLQVVSVRTGTSVWAESFDDRVLDVFQLEDVISQRVVRAWTGPKTAGPAALRRRTSNPEAYELYLRGRYFSSKRTEAGEAMAVQWFERALKVDPGDALAYAGLADAQSLLGWYGAIPAADAVSRARSSAQRALALDPGLSEPHGSLGLAACMEWRWEDADREFRKAIELDPENAAAHQMYGAMYLMPLAWSAEAIAHLERAQSLDPLSLTINSNLAAAFHYAGRYDAAVAQHKRVLEMDATFAAAHYGLALSYEQLGRVEEAIAELEALVKPATLHVGSLVALGHAYARAGRRADAARVLAELASLESRKVVSPYHLALVQAGLGLRKEALASLERAAAEHAVWVPWCRVDPRFDPLRGDPRFAAVLARAGITR